MLKFFAEKIHIFSAKNIRILYIESAKTVNKMTLNELVKLTALWTTGPRKRFEGEKIHPKRFCNHFAKGDNFSLPSIWNLFKKGILLKERICSQLEQILLYMSNPNEEVNVSKPELLPFKVYPCCLNCTPQPLYNTITGIESKNHVS